MCYLGDGTHLKLAPAITTSIQGKQGTVPSPQMTLFCSMLINPQSEYENIFDFFTKSKDQRENVFENICHQERESA